ncbi:1-deoxy-D-xylulose 5-phosphate reductoisomerase [Anaplasma marginale str. Dawn]|uniref:1-deoxy-D-xylulose 5-phosphate reductoisomerase n=3 Tax=Anaplasma marginale TaxID=770 RepID=DXR_ANAMF|nr:1-deoxy-D-xylulose-5-phosphate reductoisomerase [Anaplasma marginale]B9KIT5.1 RecName: Full=1-deoxy-D-xylulose 5-phosphate reductoisomerase; Short=DXP reductoisomerase; AltName: Full=1-deoxyxylulose-5-phosphate reductoisomerase; AltName: Full=2-C-methyl-D-erythritol 4-phosphate synthase [Anaplasma marginale str. Florida]Q5PAI9.1 RecName: Full=1-deoxy-D-xylulose 5-phosphate reductoisomerase; Short=DXP reductoisomerase; AltName: Full=1-deoxyxylulose-5-phosphate reductoisomerase; AltName: Full=2-
MLHMGRKRVSVFGSTGCIGQKAVQILRDNPDDFEVVALVAKQDAHLLASQARLLSANMAVVAEDAAYETLRELLRGTCVEVGAGTAGVMDAASRDVDSAVMAITGIAALHPVIRLIKSGVKSIALANKESVVCGGELLINAAKQTGVNIVPVDSEHNAVFQILAHDGCVARVTLTASGGPFLRWTREQMQAVTPSDALAHPVWKMGRKISVDSATMVNKALEVIEAHYLFSLDPDSIDVTVHPESVVHAVAAYPNGTSISLMSVPDMGIPTLHALYWPQSATVCGSTLDLASYGKLTFMEPDLERFPALGFGFEALRSSKPRAACIALNAANEVAVEAFLNFEIAFLDIPNIIMSAMDKLACCEVNSISEAGEYDLICRARTREICDTLKVSEFIR